MRATLKNFIHLTKKTTGLILLSTICATAHQAQASKESDWSFAQKTKIIKYLLGSVIWPESSLKNNSLHVCLLGQFDNSKPLMEINNTTINSHKIIVSKYSLKQTKNDCDLIYVSVSEKANTQKIVQTYMNKPVLLISDIANFADQGGTMNFLETKGMVALTVNVETIKNSKLTFDMNAYSHITVIPKQSDLND